MALATSYTVSSAGTTAANGTYTAVSGANGTLNGNTQYTNGTDFLSYVTTPGTPYWCISTVVNPAYNTTTQIYTTGSTALTAGTIPSSGWGSVNAGVNPAPLVASGSATATGTNSAPSNLAQATPNAVPNAPTLLTATPGNTIVTLNWTNPASLGAIVVQRRIYVAVAPFNTFANIATLPAATAGSPSTVPTTYNDTAVTNGTAYEYEVYATP